MLQTGLRKLLFNLAACLIVWWLVSSFSNYGRVYAGWLAGLLGFCYLLAAWLSFLKSRGSDPFHRLRRRQPPGVPESLRAPGLAPRRRFSWLAGRYPYEDSLEEEAEEGVNGLPLKAVQRLNAMVWAVMGALMLLLSTL